MKYVLAIVTISYAFQCLSLAILNGNEVASTLKNRAERIESESQFPYRDYARQFTEWLWFGLYLMITWRLLRS